MRILLPILLALSSAPALAHEGHQQSAPAPVSQLEQAEIDYAAFREAAEKATDYLLGLRSLGAFSMSDVLEARAANDGAYQALLDVRAARTDAERAEPLRRLYINNMRLRNYVILARTIHEQR